MKLIEKLAAQEAKNTDKKLESFMNTMTAKHLAAIRKMLGLTQETVARQLGINRSRIVGVENLAEPIVPGLHAYYFMSMEKAMKPWDLSRAKASFSFVTDVTVYSEWINLAKPNIRYYIAQTTTNLEDDEVHVEFEIFCSNGEVAEACGFNPQSIAHAEKILILKKGFIRAQDFVELTKEEREEEREGAVVNLFAAIDRAFESMAAKKA